MMLIDVEIQSVQLQNGMITIRCNDVTHENSDRFDRVRNDQIEREAIFVFDSNNFYDYEYLSEWLHKQKASEGASTWGEALNSVVGTRTQILSKFRTSWE